MTKMILIIDTTSSIRIKRVRPKPRALNGKSYTLNL